MKRDTIMPEILRALRERPQTIDELCATLGAERPRIAATVSAANGAKRIHRTNSRKPFVWAVGPAQPQF